MKLFKVLLVFTLVFHHITSTAQDNDFVVMVTNDTIYGDEGSAKHKENGKVQIKIDGSKRIYEFDRITSYYNASFGKRMYYDKVEVFDYLGTPTSYFAERLNKHKGRLNIYIHFDVIRKAIPGKVNDRDITQKQAYISKKGRYLKRFPIINSYYVKKKIVERILPYIKDNPEIALELESKKFRKHEFIDLIDRYNKSFESKE